MTAGNRWPVAAATMLLAAAACAPQVRLPRSTFDYMVTFDISQSMNVTDVSLEGGAVSRLALARAAMRETLRRLPCGSKVGWSYFADYRSFTLLLPIEVCGNYDVLLSALDRIDGRMRWANASNIAKGVYWARRYAGTVPGVDIVFFTDGQEAPPLPPGQPPMPDLTSPRVDGWLIGVGGDLPSQIPKTDDNGAQSGFWTAEMVAQDSSLPPGASHEHLSELRERYLQTLASRLGLGYQRLDSESALTRALLAKRCAHRAAVPTDIRWVPALLAMLLLIWRFAPDARGWFDPARWVRPPFGRRTNRPVQITDQSLKPANHAVTSMLLPSADLLNAAISLSTRVICVATRLTLAALDLPPEVSSAWSSFSSWASCFCSAAI